MEHENTYQPPRADIGADRPPQPGRRAGVRGDVIEELSKTRPWVLFLSILAFLFCGLMGLALVFIAIGGLVGGMGSLAGDEFGGEGAIVVVMMFIYGLLFLVSILVYFFTGLYLFRYASSISDLKNDASHESLLQAMTHQRKFWRLMGIVILVGAVFYFLMIVLVIAGGMLGALA